jgi:hypothetical protein
MQPITNETLWISLKTHTKYEIMDPKKMEALVNMPVLITP